MRGLRYLLFTGILTATVSFSNYNCGDDVEGNGPHTGGDSNTVSDVYNPKDSGHKDSDLEDKLIYPDANGDDSLDANKDIGIDADFDSGGDSEIDTGYDGGVDSGSDAQLLDGNEDVPLYDGGMDAEIDSAMDVLYNDVNQDDALDGGDNIDYDSGLDSSVDDGGDAGSNICDNLYPHDYAIPSPYNMKIPLADFLNYFSAITGFEKIKSLEGQITSDVLLQAAGNDASSMYKIISRNVLFEIDTGICEIGFDKDELNNSYQGAYNK